MILSFELPFALVPLLKFTSSKKKLGLYTYSIIISAVIWVISSLIMLINTYFLATTFVKLLLHSGLRTVSVVFAGIFGFLGMLVYITWSSGKIGNQLSHYCKLMLNLHQYPAILTWNLTVH